MAAWEAERAVLTRWAEEAKVLVKECEASRVAGLVNSLRVLSLTLCAESGACAEEKEMEEEKMEEVEKEEKVCLEESNSALRTALEKAERVTHELEDRVTGLEAAARRSQGAWEAKEKEARRLALEVESVRRLNDEMKMENEGLKRCGGEVSVSVNGVSEEKEKASEEEKEETGKEGVNEEENAMTEEKEMEEEKASEVEKEEMKVEKEEEEKEEEEKEEKMEEVVVEEKAEEEKAKEATEEKESGMEGENMVNEEKENKKEMEEEQKKEEAAYEKEEPAMKGENTVNEKEEKKEEEQNEKEQKEEENKESANEQATTPETEDNHPPKAETEKLSQKRAAEENLNPPSKKPYTLTLSTLKLRIRYAFEKWNPKWMRRMKAVSDKLDKMTKTPEEGFKEMCTMYCIGRGVMGSYKWDEAKIQEMEKIQSQSDYDAMVQEWKKDWVCLLQKRDHTAESGMRFKQEMQQVENRSGNCSSSFQPQIVSSNSLITTWYVVSACASLCVDCVWKGMLTAL